jgi:CubicO group peptidase (beta-lactamase class C family)
MLATLLFVCHSPLSRGTSSCRVYSARYAAPAFGVRAGFGYNNLLIASVGLAAGYVANGSSWDDLLQQRILTPLQMASTYSTYAAAQASAAELAVPMYRDVVNKKWVEIDPTVNADVDSFAPAGSINSNVRPHLPVRRLNCIKRLCRP